jgi:fluoroquinolone transport system permease protein
VLLAGAWFTPEPFQYLFGILPPFWVLKAHWSAAEGAAHWPLFMLVGLLLSASLLLYLVRRFERAALHSGG